MSLMESCEASTSIHHSICYNHLYSRCLQGAGADLSSHWMSGGAHPGQVAGRSQGKADTKRQITINAHVHTYK